MRRRCTPRSSSACACLPDQDDDKPLDGDLPAREQKLLLMRLAALYGPDALAYAPRAPRQRTEHDVRVVVGLQALTRAVAEVEHLSPQAKSVGAMMSYDEITQMVNPSANPDSVARRVRGSQWRLVDHSDSGCRLVAPAKDVPAKLGEIIAFQAPEGWSLAVVRRMQREQVDEVICGVEVIARRIIRVLLRTWVAPLDAEHAAIDRPFFGVYIPAHAANRAGRAAQPDRPRRPPDGRRHGRARYRQCALSRPLQPDDRAPGRLVVGPVQRGAEAVRLNG